MICDAVLRDERTCTFTAQERRTCPWGTFDLCHVHSNLWDEMVITHGLYGAYTRIYLGGQPPARTKDLCHA